MKPTAWLELLVEHRPNSVAVRIPAGPTVATAAAPGPIRSTFSRSPFDRLVFTHNAEELCELRREGDRHILSSGGDVLAVFERTRTQGLSIRPADARVLTGRRVTDSLAGARRQIGAAPPSRLEVLDHTGARMVTIERRRTTFRLRARRPLDWRVAVCACLLLMT